jgi:hypothetical protein
MNFFPARNAETGWGRRFPAGSHCPYAGLLSVSKRRCERPPLRAYGTANVGR